MAEIESPSKRKLATGAKRRHRDTLDGTERNHKKSKSQALLSQDENVEELASGSPVKSQEKGEKKSKKSTRSKDSRSSEADENDDAIERKRTSKKDPKKSKGSHSKVDDGLTTGDSRVVVLHSARSKTLPDGDLPRGRKYPFYTQTVSQYLPLQPLGILEPVQGYAHQHLQPLLNRHVPSIGGVLLAYRHPRIGEAPGKSSLTEESGMEDVTLLESINEYAVSFGWLTVEIDLFRPARGAWLEGLVNFQGEGHIGLVCWGKFNASIESGRLPHDWRWIDHLGSSHTNANTSAETALTAAGGTEHAEVHATGYWVDGNGARIASDKPLCFRIKNYEVGSSGEYGYLSIEGTMLPEEEEANKVREEVRSLRQKIRHGSLRRERRPLLESSMTKFTDDDEQERESRPPEV
ncbi:hypothetical protein GGR50DRAFT_424295 [Xylaria sp. CBS 124048]|nr:hypothetical protein GGR50DRAFT_424295 [Xylaria sp. CBS 124048]